jgi:hypothetical protein
MRGTRAIARGGCPQFFTMESSHNAIAEECRRCSSPVARYYFHFLLVIAMKVNYLAAAN